jgi:hypothetical protein
MEAECAQSNDVLKISNEVGINGTQYNCYRYCIIITGIVLRWNNKIDYYYRQSGEGETSNWTCVATARSGTVLYIAHCTLIPERERGVEEFQNYWSTMVSRSRTARLQDPKPGRQRCPHECLAGGGTLKSSHTA